MAYSVTITNPDQPNNKKFRFYEAEVPNLSLSFNTKLIKQEFAEDEDNGENAIVINLGIDRKYRLQFRLTDTTDSSQDAAVGTHTSDVYTVQEKMDYLINTFLTNEATSVYTLEITTMFGTFSSIKGMIEDLSIDINSANPTYVNGTLTITIGGKTQ